MFNEILSHLNWLHILVATLAFFALGALWYSPVLFAKPWTSMNTVPMDADKKGMGMAMLLSFIFMFVASTGIAILQQVLAVSDAVHGIKLGLLVGVCFSVPSISISYVYLKRPVGLYFIDGGYQLVGCILASLVLAVWH